MEYEATPVVIQPAKQSFSFNSDEIVDILRDHLRAKGFIFGELRPYWRYDSIYHIVRGLTLTTKE